ncbi:DUF3465 domain-containing protein [Cellvibrio sp.]|uniref:DUF3465 domain-containing protein n=1 Tax=Cellvibrio sp. TaxID=1965322 RepID=UPI0039648C83
MKNKLMLLVIVAGLATAIHRFLPASIQHQVDSVIAPVAAVTAPAPASSQKKYVLQIPDEPASLSNKSSVEKSNESDVANAYLQHAQDVQVLGEGEVIKVLADDNQGSKHQRFILRMPEGFTVLVAHNIDLAPRVRNIAVGDKVSFYGEYVWNEKGGVVHWTHSDPHGRHASGWLKHKGITYQ